MAKTKKPSEKEIKPFQVKHHLFYPCQMPSSLKDSYLYYLLSFNRKGIVQIESNSPRFKNKEDAILFVEEGKLNVFVENRRRL